MIAPCADAKVDADVEFFCFQVERLAHSFQIHQQAGVYVLNPVVVLLIERVHFAPVDPDEQTIHLARDREVAGFDRGGLAGVCGAEELVEISRTIYGALHILTRLEDFCSEFVQGSA